MATATELIDWYWAEIEALDSSAKHYVLEKDGMCQCTSENIISDCSDPHRMRAFLMTGILIDQMMFTHFGNIYLEFRETFRFPKLLAHGGYGMAGPGWFSYSNHGYDEKVDWAAVSTSRIIPFDSTRTWPSRRFIGYAKHSREVAPPESFINVGTRLSPHPMSAGSHPCKPTRIGLPLSR